MAIASKVLRLSHTWEFAIVLLGAFGYFAAGSLHAAFYPSALPPISQHHLQYLLVFEPVMLVLLCSFLHLRGWTLRRVSAPPATKDLMSGLVLVIASYVAGFIIWNIVRRLGLQPTYPGNYTVLVNAGLKLPTVVASSVVNAVYEEIFLCGYIVTTLKAKFNSTLAVNVSVAVRLIYHLYQGSIGVLTVIPIGLLFTGWYARTGRLWPLFLAHAAIDLISLSKFVG